MLLLLPLLRRLSIRTRVTVGALLAVAGLVGLVVGLTTRSGPVVQAAIALFVGAVLLVSAWTSVRRAGGGARVAVGRR